MPVAPVTVRALRYNGRDPRRLAKRQEQIDAGKLLAQNINARVPADGCRIFSYRELAYDVGIDLDTVSDLLGAAGGGNTGITVWGKDFKPPTPK